MFYSELFENVITGPYPGVDGVNFFDNSCIDDLQKKGVNIFVSLQEEISVLGELDENFRPFFPGYTIHYKYRLNHDAEWYHYPIKDCSIPYSMENFIYFIDELKYQLSRGKKLYIHCAGGHGRTGIVGVCLLSLLENMSIESAIKKYNAVHSSRMLDRRQKSLPVTLNKTQIEFCHKFMQKYFSVDPEKGNLYKYKNNSTTFKCLDGYCVGGMSAEMAFCNNISRVYKGWNNTVFGECKEDIIVNTIKYVGNIVKFKAPKSVLISPGTLCVPYFAYYTNSIYLPSHFLVSVTDIKDLEKMLKYTKDRGYDCYACLGFDYAYPKHILAWIKFRKNVYTKFLKGVEQIYSLSTFNTQMSNGSENIFRKYSEDIYCTFITESLTKDASDDLARFMTMIKNFDVEKICPQRCEFLGDWESSIDYLSDFFEDDECKKEIIWANDTKDIYNFATHLAKRFFIKNNKPIRGIVFNPYYIANPKQEYSSGYIPYLYWQYSDNFKDFEKLKSGSNHIIITKDLYQRDIRYKELLEETKCESYIFDDNGNSIIEKISKFKVENPKLFLNLNDVKMIIKEYGKLYNI